MNAPAISTMTWRTSVQITASMPPRTVYTVASTPITAIHAYTLIPVTTESDAQPTELHEQEHGAAEQASRYIEAFLQVLIRGGDIQPPIEGDEDFGHDWDDQEEEEDVEHVEPVCGVELGGAGHEGDGAEHGAEHAEARGPPRDAPPGFEEIVRGLFTLGEVRPHDHKRQEI